MSPTFYGYSTSLITMEPPRPLRRVGYIHKEPVFMTPASASIDRSPASHDKREGHLSIFPSPLNFPWYVIIATLSDR